MTTKERLSKQLERLAAELGRRPSVVEPVLERIANERLATASAAAGLNQRKWRYVFSLAAGLFIAVSVPWWIPAEPSLAFAEVQAAIRTITTVAGKAHYPNAPHKDEIGYMSADHKTIRAELPGGLVVVMAPDGKRLMLNTRDRVAYIGTGQPPVEEDRVRHVLLELSELDEKAVRVLGDRVVNGQRLQGFVVPTTYLNASFAKLIETRVWVDPSTRLPVVVEHVPVDPNNVVAKALHRVITYELNVPLEDSLFSMDPPVGYRLVKEGGLFPMPPPVLPKGMDLHSLIVYPKKGIGKARFGMSVDQIYEVLGVPDFTDYSLESSKEIDQLREQISNQKGDKSQLQKQLQALRDSTPPDTWWLLYRSLGFELTVGREGGLMGITCYGKQVQLSDMVGYFVILRNRESFWGGTTSFVGRTTEGITVESTTEDIINTYGKPTEISRPENKDENVEFLIYVDDEDGRMIFAFVSGRLNNVVFYAPRRGD